MREQKTFIINTMSEDRYRILSAKLPSNQLHIVDDSSSSGRTVLASYDLVSQKHDDAIKAIQENINDLELKYDLSTCQIQLIDNEQIITTFDAKPFISDNYLSGAEFVEDKLNLHIARYVSSGISSYIDENGETVVKELSGIVSVNVISVDFPIEHEWTDSLSSSQSPIQASAIYTTVTDISDAVALSAAEMSAATALSIAEISNAVALSVAGISVTTALSVAEISDAVALSVAGISAATALSVAEMSSAIALSVAEISDAVALSAAGMSAAITLSVAEISDAIALSVAGMSATTALSVDTMSAHVALSVDNLHTDVDTMSSHIAISVDTMSVHVALSVDNLAQDIANKVKVGDFNKELSAVDELSVVRIDAEEYYKRAKQRQLDPTTVYILSGEYFNAYNMPIKNLGDPVSANDAVNLKKLSTVSGAVALSVAEISDAVALSVNGISNAVALSVAGISAATALSVAGMSSAIALSVGTMSAHIALSVAEMSTAVALSASRLETKITNISDAVALSVNTMSSHIAMSVDCLSNYIAGLDQSYTVGNYQIFNTIEQKNGRISANFKPLNLETISGMQALQISVQTNTGNISTLDQRLISEIANRAADDGYLSGQIDGIVETLIPGAITSANTYTDNQLDKLSLSRPTLENKLVTETDIAKFDQIMHFVGTITEAEPNPISSTSYTAWGDNQYKPGDVQVSIKSGKEFVFLSSNSTASTEYRWEVIGDQNTYLPKTSYDTWKSTVILSVAEISDAVALSVAGISTATALSVAGISTAVALSVAGISTATALSVAGMSAVVALSVAGMSAATALSVDTMSAHVALSVDNLNYDIVNKIKAGDFGDELSNVNELSVVRIDAKEYYKRAKQRKLDPTTIYLLSNDCFNAYNMPIKNLGDPVSTNDAVNLKKLSTVSAAVALSVAGISAATALSVAGISAATALSVAGMSAAIALSVDMMSSHIALSVDNLNYGIVNKIKAGDFGDELSAVDELSVVRIDAEEYYKRAKQHKLDPTTVYILSAEDYNVYNRKIINLKDPEADTDAVNLRYVSRVETKFTNFMTDLSNDLHPILSSRSIDFGTLSGAVYSIYDRVLEYFNN